LVCEVRGRAEAAGHVLAAVAVDISVAGHHSSKANRSLLMTPMFLRPHLKAIAVGAVLALPAASALAATCGTGNFQAWLDEFKS
jgi:predicted NAD/FAD-dependent oxidoreductase